MQLLADVTATYRLCEHLHGHERGLDKVGRWRVALPFRRHRLQRVWVQAELDIDMCRGVDGRYWECERLVLALSTCTHECTVQRERMCDHDVLAENAFFQSAKHLAM